LNPNVSTRRQAEPEEEEVKEKRMIQKIIQKIG